MKNKSSKDNLPHALSEVILDIAVDAIITINSAGVINAFKPAAEKLFGYFSNEVIGQKINILMPEPC